MSTRPPSTRSSRRNAAARALADSVELLGQPTIMPCSFCHRNNRSCIMDPARSSSCSECIRRKGRCDGVDVGDKLSVALREIRRIEEEEGKLMKQALEIQAKVVRLREQKLHMQRQQEDLFNRGMVEFEKDLREREGSSSAPAVGNLSAVDDGVDWAALNALSPGVLEQLAAGPLAVSDGQDFAGASSQSHS
ncbi:hypothetical protein B0T09DRAFT_333195 [Sordaria sp. MPI-SDFR-AT-0083]|nr:hypothetical protein B0T09DRAFT_333195 [Sordaria sp. MPI-SDFR-AT-0083]